ncbi:MAG: VOC family protein [Psychrobium sp.]
MKLGAFSHSLNVKDLQASKAFYEKLGFETFAGNTEYNYLIMKNEDVLIGLFQGMFTENIMTFNPGWDQNAAEVDEFNDVRELHNRLQTNGVEIIEASISGESGPSSFSIKDPDGNKILFDQHI